MEIPVKTPRDVTGRSHRPRVVPALLLSSSRAPEADSWQTISDFVSHGEENMDPEIYYFQIDYKGAETASTGEFREGYTQGTIFVEVAADY